MLLLEWLTETSLAPFEDHLVHGLIGVAGHGPRIVVDDEVLHAIAIHEDIVHEAHAFAEGDEIQVVGEEV